MRFRVSVTAGPDELSVALVATRLQQVAYTHECLVKLQGQRAATSATGTLSDPFEIVYSTIPTVNDIAQEHVRIPTLRVAGDA